MNVHLLNQIALGCAVLSLALTFAALAPKKWDVRGAMWLSLLATIGCVLASSYASWCGLNCVNGSWFEDGNETTRHITTALLVISFGIIWMFGMVGTAQSRTDPRPSSHERTAR